MSLRNKMSSLLATGLMVLLLSVAAMAQFNGGLEGTVTDATGAVISGAKITITNQETNASRETVSGATGTYRVTGLAPGKYSVKAENGGFNPFNTTDIQITQDIANIDFSMTAGAVAQTVTVTASAEEPLHTEDANVSKTISNAEIKGLPQVGRDPYELIRLTPGVFGDASRGGNGGAVGLGSTLGPGGSSTSIFQTENAPQITANGQRISANNYSIDGVSVNSLGFGGAAVVTPNQESVKEITVRSSTYSAEDGRNSGAQVKVVSQNGTNQFHGSGIFKYDEPGLNAFNKYGGPNIVGGKIGKPNPPTRVNNKLRQYAGSVGGPIIKDKLFFFGSYEGQRVNNSFTADVFSETPEYRALVRSIRPGGKTATVFGLPGIEPRVVSILPADCSRFNNDPTRCRVVPGGLDLGSPTGSLNNYVSLGNPTGGGFDGVPDVRFVRIVAPSQVRGNQYNGRLDYNRGNDQFAVSGYLTKLNRFDADASSGSRPISDLRFKPTNDALTFTYLRTLSATALNEARVNFTRFAGNQITDSSTTNFGVPRIEVEGLPFDRIRFGAPRGSTTPAILAQNTYEFRDTLNKVLGPHGMKFGLELRREQDNNNLIGESRPVYSFVGLFNLANDTPIFEGIFVDPRTGGPSSARHHFRTNAYAGFVQDDWKFRSNLTFNLGLRYEYFTPIRDKDNNISNLVFGPGGTLAATKVVPVNGYLFNPDRNNFAPRLGFAWSPEGYNNNLVIRGGMGVSYNRIPDVLFSNTFVNPPFSANYNICCGTSPLDFSTPFAGGQILYALGSSNSAFSYPVNPALGQGIDPATGIPKGFGAVELYGAPKNVPNPYVYTYSLGTEYRFPYDVVFELGYQGSDGHKQTRLLNQNFVQAPNPKLFATYFVTPDVNSNFNAMNARVSRQFRQGFTIDANYRWSRSTDYLSNEGPGAESNQTDPAHQKTERGPSDYDIAQNATVSGLWDLPIFRNHDTVAGKFLGGFTLSGIFTAHTGFPYTPTTCRIASVPVTGAANICPTRPIGYNGRAGSSSENSAFLTGSNFPGGGLNFFDVSKPGTPGIGRNSFRGPRYSSTDLTLAKAVYLGTERAKLNLQVNLFNAFNQLNLLPLRFGSNNTRIEDPNFGLSPGGEAGRVVELQARFTF